PSALFTTVPSPNIGEETRSPYLSVRGSGEELPAVASSSGSGGRSRWQNRQILASLLIISAQKGHFRIPSEISSTAIVISDPISRRYWGPARIVATVTREAIAGTSS